MLVIPPYLPQQIPQLSSSLVFLEVVTAKDGKAHDRLTGLPLRFLATWESEDGRSALGEVVAGGEKGRFLQVLKDSNDREVLAWWYPDKAHLTSACK